MEFRNPQALSSCALGLKQIFNKYLYSQIFEYNFGIQIFISNQLHCITCRKYIRAFNLCVEVTCYTHQNNLKVQKGIFEYSVNCHYRIFEYKNHYSFDYYIDTCYRSHTGVCHSFNVCLNLIDCII